MSAPGAKGSAVIDRRDVRDVRRTDPCREAGKQDWRTIDEVFPLLKYDSSRSTQGIGLTYRQSRTSSLLENNDIVGDAVRPVTSALKAGWICFGLGLLLSWFFPLGNAFFSVAIIAAVVAMCTHEVNRGLVLLLTSFVGIGLSALVFFALVVGTIGAVVAPTVRKASAEVKHTQRAQERDRKQFDAASRKMQSAFNNAVGQMDSQLRHASALPAPGQKSAPAFERQRQHELALASAREAQKLAAADEAKRQQNISNAERQRDVAKAKEQQLQRLQSSLDWWDKQVTDARVSGRDARWLGAQRDQAWKQKQDFQSR